MKKQKEVMSNEFKDFEEFLKQKEEFIKQIEKEKETTKEITYGVHDDLARGIEEYQKKMDKDVSEDFDKSYGQNYLKIAFDSLKTFFGLLFFNKESLRKAYLVTSTKRLFVLYSVFAIALAGAILFWDTSKVEIAPYAGVVAIISPFLLYIAIQLIAYVQQLFFFLFSGENKTREIAIVNSYALLFFIPLLYLKGSPLLITTFVIGMYAFIFQTWALSSAFKIKKWQSASAILLMWFLPMGIYLFFQIFHQRIKTLI
ncbi:MAG: hypothetical protein PWP03_400 [Candidatus Woesearchaeota archaeon]|nr:hypothetical protein [Candidatus Woesearchaeota archaeon]